MQKKFFLPLLGLLGLPSVAVAETFNYTTYGGFDAVFIAIQKIVLITSDGSFSALVGAAAVIGIILGGIMSISSAAQTGNKVSINFIFAMMLGTTIYASMFVKTATLTIEDEAFNKMGVVEDVPYGLAFLLHHFSKIEVGIIELTDTATMGGESYAGAVGGMGLNTTRAVVSYQLRDSVIRVSMKKYIEDCVLFELVRPGTDLSLNDLHYGSADLITTLEKAASPSIFTVYQNEGGGDTTMTCQGAYTSIKNWFGVPSNLEAEVDRACGSAFFNTANIQEKTRCREVVSETLLKATGVNMTSEKLLTQALITNVFMDVARSGDAATVVEVEANQQAGSSLFGMGVAASEWIPVIKGVITAVFISLIPFLAIFLVTPIYGRVLSFIVGFVAFVTTWGIVDAIANGLMVSYSYQFLSTLQGETNMFAMMAFPTLTMKTVAMIGGVRSMGAMISALVVSVLFPKLNSQAFAMLAGGLQGVTQSAGTKAGQLITPEGTSHEISQHQSAMGTQSMYSSGRFDVDGARNMAMNDTKNKIASSWQGEGYRDFGDAMSLGSTRGHVASGSTDQTQLMAGKYAGGDERRWGAMTNGNQTYVANNGSNAVAVTPEGEEVKNARSVGNTAQIATQNGETVQVQKNSAGDFSVSAKDVTQTSKDKVVSQGRSEVERAGETLNKSWSTTKSKATSLLNSTQNLEGLSDSEQQTVTSAFSAIVARSTSGAETTNFSDNSAQQDTSSNRSTISVNGEGSLSSGKPQAGQGGGSAGGSISGGSSLEKGHSDTTGHSAGSNLNHTDSTSVTDNKNETLAKAKQILESHGYSKQAQETETLQTNYNAAEGHTADYSKMVESQRRMEESQRLAEQHNIDGGENLDKPMMQLANDDKYIDKYNVPEEYRNKAWEYFESTGNQAAQREVQKDFLNNAAESLRQTGDFGALEKQWGVELDGKLEAGKAAMADVDPAATHAATAKEIEGKAADQIKAPNYNQQEQQLELDFEIGQQKIRTPAEAEIAEAAKTTNIMANYVENNAAEATHKGLAEDVLDRFEGLYNKIPNIFER